MGNEGSNSGQLHARQEPICCTNDVQNFLFLKASHSSFNCNLVYVRILAWLLEWIKNRVDSLLKTNSCKYYLICKNKCLFLPLTLTVISILWHSITLSFCPFRKLLMPKIKVRPCSILLRHDFQPFKLSPWTLYEVLLLWNPPKSFEVYLKKNEVPLPYHKC